LIHEKKDGKLFIASNSGLVVFNTDFQSEAQIRYHFYGQGKIQSGLITKGDIQHICHTSNRKTYLSTCGGGINFVKEYTQEGSQKTFGFITREDGLGSNYILSITEDRNHNLWIVSESNITHYDPLQNSFDVFSLQIE
jgi:ligand-binding sensor domain-containing protein